MQFSFRPFVQLILFLSATSEASLAGKWYWCNVKTTSHKIGQQLVNYQTNACCNIWRDKSIVNGLITGTWLPAAASVQPFNASVLKPIHTPNQIKHALVSFVLESLGDGLKKKVVNQVEFRIQSQFFFVLRKFSVLARKKRLKINLLPNMPIKYWHLK